MKFDELSAELQDKVLACETVEDVLALAKAEGIELSDEELEAVSGGVDLRGTLEALLRGRYIARTEARTEARGIGRTEARMEARTEARM